MNVLLFSFTVAGGVIVVLFACIILYKIATDKIDLKDVLCDGADAKASLARLQFLIFTLVIALSYFLLVMRANAALPADKFILPDISNGVLGLMGISGGSYVLSKGISKAAEVAASPSGDPATTVQGVPVG